MKITKWTVFKAILFVLSAWAFCKIFSYPTGLLVFAGLVTHEYGHVWAAKKVGWATQGMTFIPFVGGIAWVTPNKNSSKNNAYVALMGPAWGMCALILMHIVALITGNKSFSDAAHWTALINLFNLLPIYPLDGGRVAQAIIVSWGGQKANIICVFVALVVSLLTGIITPYKIFILLAYYLAMEIPVHWENYKFMKTLDNALVSKLASVITSDHKQANAMALAVQQVKENFKQVVVETMTKQQMISCTKVHAGLCFLFLLVYYSK